MNKKGRKTMKVLIIYYSQTGNTQKIARAWGESVSGRGKRILAGEEGLLPLEQVGTKTPFYSVHASHPRIRQLSFLED